MEDNRNNNGRGNVPLIQGDGTAIDGLHYSVDSHDASNFNNTTNSNNMSNSNNNTTNNFYQQSEGQRLADAKKEYLNFCRLKIKDGLISPQIRRELDDLGVKLSLEADVMYAIEQSVKNTSSTKEILSEVDRTYLSLVMRKVESNASNMSDVLQKMEAMAQKVEQENVQYWYYLLLAIEDSSLCIKRYDERKCDNYWQSYWTFMACLRNGLLSKAGLVLADLEKWEYSIDNIKLLQCAELMYSYFNGKGTVDDKSLALNILKECYSFHHLLEDFQNVLEHLMKCENKKIVLSKVPKVNYYLRLFGVKPISSILSDKEIQSFDTANKKKGIYNFSNEEQPQISEEALDLIHRVHRGVEIMNGKNPGDPTIVDKLKIKWKRNKKKIYIILIAVVLFVVGKNLFTDETKTSIPKVDTAAINVEKEIEQNQKTNNKSTKSNIGASIESKTLSTKKNEKNNSSSTTKEAKEKATSASVQSITEKPVVVELTADDYVKKGLASTFDDAKALDYFLKAVAKGSNEANLHIGHLYYNGGSEISKNYATAFDYYMKAATKGLVEAQYMVGKMYRNGQGVPKDLNSAKDWLRKASSQGHTEAIRLLNSI